MYRSLAEYLRHILDEAAYLNEQVKDLTKEAFLSDETKKRAFVRSLEVIREATKQLPQTRRDRYD